MHSDRILPAPRPRPLWKAALLAVTTATIANVLLARLSAIVLGLPADFLPLQPGPTGFFTVIGVTGAALALALISRLTSSPRRVFRNVALVVLLLSVIPDLLLLRTSPFAGTTPAGIWTLILLHVVACGVSLVVLNGRGSGLTSGRSPSGAS